MRYLITGGLGFLGVNLAKYLLDTDPGAEIVIVDPALGRVQTLARFTGREQITVNTAMLISDEQPIRGPYIPDERLSWRVKARQLVNLGESLQDGRSRVEVHLCAMRNLHICTQETDAWQPDRIYHLASYGSPVVYRRRASATLCTGAVDTMEVVRRSLQADQQPGPHGPCRILLASTSEVYGDPEVGPQHESYRGNVCPVGPRSMYDESKRFAEAVIADAVANGVNARIARIFNTYGPGMSRHDGRMIPAFIAACASGDPLPVHEPGTQTRSLCYVDDTIRGLASLMESDHPELISTAPGGRRQVQPVNIGNPHEMSVSAIASAVCHAWGRATGQRPSIALGPNPCSHDPRNRRPDITRARAWLEWEPEIPLDEGLDRTIADWIALEG